MDADVVIVGTGPAGGMAACRLAATGLKTLILEKGTLPRTKPCGGAMPSRVKKIIDWDFDHLVESKVFGVKNQYNYARDQMVQSAEPILMVRRDQFDHHLIERAVRLGKGDVQLRERVRVKHVTENDDTVVVRADNGTQVEARYLIAGDGAYSKAASCLGLTAVSNAVAIDAEVEVAPDVYETEKSRATFNYFCLDNGYGWIFPKAGYLSCGVGAWRGNPKLRHALDDFLAKSFPRGSVRSVHAVGHAIPLYSGQRTIATRRVCLVGDAANLVDPILGEGIRFALLSGGLAADVITRNLEARGHADRPAAPEHAHGDCRDYQTAIAQRLGDQLGNLYRFISPIFLQAPEFFYRKFVSQGNNYLGLSQQLASHLHA